MRLRVVYHSVNGGAWLMGWNRIAQCVTPEELPPDVGTVFGSIAEVTAYVPRHLSDITSYHMVTVVDMDSGSVVHRGWRQQAGYALSTRKWVWREVEQNTED